MLAMSIDKERDVDVWYALFKERGAGCWILGTLSLVECKAVSPGLCAYLLLFRERVINISGAALAESLLQLQPSALAARSTSVAANKTTEPRF